MADIGNTLQPPQARRRGHRLWIPFTVGLLAVAGIVAIRMQPEMEQNFKDWLTVAITLVAMALGLLWFLLLSRFSGWLRVEAFLLLALLGFGATKVLHVDGTISGNGLPRLTWRWTSSHAALPAVAPAAVPATNAISVAMAQDIPDTPQFRGPNRDGVINGLHLAHDWTTAPPKQLWRQPVGAGWSAFAVVGGRAYTQEQRGENECVTCYDLLTGHPVWSHTDAARFFQWQGGEGPRATPTVIEGRVFTVGATGILNCLDAATGQGLWKRDVLEENKLPNLIWGVSDSPLVFDDFVIVTGGLSNGFTVLAYRRSNGESLWHSGSDKAGYASPILATVAGKRVVLSANAGSFTAHDPATGELLLNQPWTEDKWPKASQPVVLDGDRVFVSAGYGSGCALFNTKSSADGKLTATQLWKNMHMKTQFNSASARDGFLYGLDDGLLACVEIASGDRKWKDGHFGAGQTLLVDDLVIIQSEPGPVVLAEAKPDAYKELGRIAALNAKTWNYPTVAGKYLLVRNSEEMACYELPVQEQSTRTASR
jgi:outer membrane protein assembly factor BamB